MKNAVPAVLIVKELHLAHPNMIEQIEGLERLRQLVEESNWEKPIREELLICFLRARKYNVDRAFKSLKGYVKMVKNYPDLLTNLSTSRLRTQLKPQLQLLYKPTDKLGRRIFIFRAGRWNPSEQTLEDIFRCNVFYLQHLATKVDAQLNGIVAIVDLGGVCMQHAKHFTPLFAKKIADLLTGAFPLSFQVIHIVNQNWMVSVLMSIIWPFLSSKIQKRIQYHGNYWASLHEHIEAADLPEDYGGFRARLDHLQSDGDVIVPTDGHLDLFDLN